jgi:heme oxygenase
MMMNESIQSRLRAATHACHVRINRHPLLMGLTGRSCALPTYCRVLRAYYEIYRGLEIAISLYAPRSPRPFDYEPRRKLPWIAQDLAYFQIDPVCPPPLFHSQAPEINTPGQFIGALYPIEGATLGGQTIIPHLQNSLGLDATRGARFFSAYGAHTASRWQDYCRFADSILGNAEQERLAQETAMLVFNQFEEALNEHHRILGARQ